MVIVTKNLKVNSSAQASSSCSTFNTGSGAHLHGVPAQDLHRVGRWCLKGQVGCQERRPQVRKLEGPPKVGGLLPVGPPSYDGVLSHIGTYTQLERQHGVRTACD